VDAARHALDTQYNLQNDQYIRAEGQGMELEGKVHHHGRFFNYEYPSRNLGSLVHGHEFGHRKNIDAVCACALLPRAQRAIHFCECLVRSLNERKARCTDVT